MGNVLKLFGAASLWAVSVAVAGAVLTEKVESFPVSDVRLTESVFKRAEDLDVRYLLGLDPDRLLAPYLKIIPTGKIRDWTATSAGIIFRPWPICMRLRAMRKSGGG